MHKKDVIVWKFEYPLEMVNEYHNISKLNSSTNSGYGGGNKLSYVKSYFKSSMMGLSQTP